LQVVVALAVPRLWRHRPVQPSGARSKPHRPSPTQTAPQHSAVSSLEVYSTSARRRSYVLIRHHVGADVKQT
jgi:hypothetical protein